MNNTQYNSTFPTKAVLTVPNFENKDFQITGFNIPGISINPVSVSNPATALKVAGDHLTYATLDCEFIVTEGLTNWLELYEWVKGLGFPNDYKQYKDQKYRYKDLILQTMTNLNNTNHKFTFVGAFPIALGSIEYNTNDTDAEYIKTSVEFAYTYFSVE